MKEKEFNLSKEPWIRVALNDGNVVEKSLLDVLENAHCYKRLAGEMPAQDIAVLRFIVALVHTIYTKTGSDDKESLVSKEEECIERWKNLWCEKAFPMNLIKDYLCKWDERFWLFHPERPFYQVPKANIGTKNTVSKLNGAVSESNNKARLFSQLAGIGKESMTYAESARWLIFLNGFDDCAAKQIDKSEGSRGSTIAWLGKLGLVYAIGENLFETIMLNMPMLYGKDEIPWSEDIPTWENKEIRSRERETIEMPCNLAELYTLQSRRILLKRENERVTGYTLLGGDAFEDTNALNEPMTLWRIIKDKKTDSLYYKPMLHERDRYIWRNFSAFTSTASSAIKPGIVSWCDRLRREKIIKKNRMLIFGIGCVRYDSSQSSSITDSFADDISFQANLLSDSGKYWREEIYRQIEKIERAAYFLNLLICDIRRANGLDPKKDEFSSAEAKQLFFYEVDLLFREWLMSIDAEQDAEERNDVATDLEEQIRGCAFQIGREIISQSGESAFVGRNVEVSKNIIKHYSSSEAYMWFKKNIWNLYPTVKGDESVGE